MNEHYEGSKLEMVLKCENKLSNQKILKKQKKRQFSLNFLFLHVHFLHVYFTVFFVVWVHVVPIEGTNRRVVYRKVDMLCDLPWCFVGRYWSYFEIHVVNNTVDSLRVPLLQYNCGLCYLLKKRVCTLPHTCLVHITHKYI